MNVVFLHGLAASCFADMLKTDQHREPLLNFITNKIVGYSSGRWAFDPDASNCLQGLRPTNSNPKISELQIWIDCSNVQTTPDGSLYTKDIDWMVVDYPVDEYGMKDLKAERRNGIRGGFINHGTFEKPDWSSHT